MFIALEGPIGVGKTSLGNILAKRLNARFFADPVERSVRIFGATSADPLATELEILGLRLSQLRDIKSIYVGGQTVVADWDLCKSEYFGPARLNSGDLKTLYSFGDLVQQTSLRPDLVVFVESDAQTIEQRISTRGRVNEQSIDLRQIQSMVEAYAEIAQRAARAPGKAVILFDNRHGLEQSATRLVSVIQHRQPYGRITEGWAMHRALSPNA